MSIIIENYEVTSKDSTFILDLPTVIKNNRNTQWEMSLQKLAMDINPLESSNHILLNHLTKTGVALQNVTYNSIHSFVAEINKSLSSYPLRGKISVNESLDLILTIPDLAFIHALPNIFDSNTLLTKTIKIGELLYIPPQIKREIFNLTIGSNDVLHITCDIDDPHLTIASQFKDKLFDVSAFIHLRYDIRTKTFFWNVDTHKLNIKVSRLPRNENPILPQNNYYGLFFSTEIFPATLIKSPIINKEFLPFTLEKSPNFYMIKIDCLYGNEEILACVPAKPSILYSCDNPNSFLPLGAYSKPSFNLWLKPIGKSDNVNMNGHTNSLYAQIHFRRRKETPML